MPLFLSTLSGYVCFFYANSGFSSLGGFVIFCCPFPSFVFLFGYVHLLFFPFPFILSSPSPLLLHSPFLFHFLFSYRLCSVCCFSPFFFCSSAVDQGSRDAGESEQPCQSGRGEPNILLPPPPNTMGRFSSPTLIATLNTSRLSSLRIFQRLLAKAL